MQKATAVMNLDEFRFRVRGSVWVQNLPGTSEHGVLCAKPGTGSDPQAAKELVLEVIREKDGEFRSGRSDFGGRLGGTNLDVRPAPGSRTRTGPPSPRLANPRSNLSTGSGSEVRRRHRDWQERRDDQEDPERRRGQSSVQSRSGNRWKRVLNCSVLNKSKLPLQTIIIINVPIIDPFLVLKTEAECLVLVLVLCV